MKQKKQKAGWLWLNVLLLFVFVAATTFVVMDRLDRYMINDTGAIPLVVHTETVTPPKNPQQSSTATPTDRTQNTGTTNTTDPNQPFYQPGFQVGDQNGVWGNETQVEIFRVSYENGEKTVTVQSSNGDSLIAPGTENSYVFKLKNTGNVNIEYKMEVDAFFDPAEVPLPVSTRLSRYDAAWLVGDNDQYDTVAALDAAADSDTLSPGHYTYYTLDWRWDFEGDDAYDTYLGNLAVQQDLSFTIVIRTVAEATGEGGGIPPTGDNGVQLWLLLEILSLVAIVILVSIIVVEKRRARREA